MPVAYEIDPAVLANAAAGALDLPLENGGTFAVLTDRLANVYPDIVEKRPPRWMMIEAGGILESDASASGWRRHVRGFVRWRARH